VVPSVALVWPSSHVHVVADVIIDAGGVAAVHVQCHAAGLVVPILQSFYEHAAARVDAGANVVAATNVECFVFSAQSVAARAVASPSLTASSVYAGIDIAEKDTG